MKRILSTVLAALFLAANLSLLPRMVEFWRSGGASFAYHKQEEAPAYSYRNDAPYLHWDRKTSSAAAQGYLQPGQSFSVRNPQKEWLSCASPCAGLRAEEILEIGVDMGWQKSYSMESLGEINVVNNSDAPGNWGIYPIYIVHSADLYRGDEYLGPISFTEAVSCGIGALRE